MSAMSLSLLKPALDHLIQKSLDYENLNKEDSLLKQQRMFHDLLAGHLKLTDEQFAERMQELSLPHTYGRLGVIVVEIDHYPHFTSQYVTKDQHLLKFILENAFHDLGQQNNRFVWHAMDAAAANRFCRSSSLSASHGEKSLRALAEEFLQWIRKALALTVDDRHRCRLHFHRQHRRFVSQRLGQCELEDRLRDEYGDR